MLTNSVFLRIYSSQINKNNGSESARRRNFTREFSYEWVDERWPQRWLYHDLKCRYQGLESLISIRSFEIKSQINQSSWRWQWCRGSPYWASNQQRRRLVWLWHPRYRKWPGLHRWWHLSRSRCLLFRRRVRLNSCLLLHVTLSRQSLCLIHGQRRYKKAICGNFKR